ncbi:MAG: inositol monophosphatase [Gammaproteobacteria bacterium]|nr:inositol monophosphatase [Gammaproteobacteria bacterium]
MRPYLNIAIKAAREAGQIIMHATDRLQDIAISEKSAQNFVTEVDYAAEQRIIEILHDAYPNHTILAEESGHSRHENSNDEYLWIIDPLDGTLNFIHGYPYFAVSIALQYRGRLAAAVIYDPIRQDLFAAEQGAGAQKNNQRIRVSKRIHLQETVLATGSPSRAHTNQNVHFDAFKRLDGICCGIRHSGSAVLDLAHVASGQLDGIWRSQLKPWDMAAGALLIKEAGGLVSDFTGAEEYLTQGNIVAGNRKIFKALLVEIKNPKI